MRRGRVSATAAFVLGIGVSVAANVAHASYPSDETVKALHEAGKSVEDWSPPLGGQLMSAFYPLALLLCVEVLARVEWPRTFEWKAARYGGASAVAAVAAVVSYRHMAGLLDHYGEDSVTVAIGPLAVDGLMVVSGVALLALGSHTKPPRSPAGTVPPVVVNGTALEVSANGHGKGRVYPDEHQLRGARVFADDVTAGRVPGLRAIKQQLRIGQDRAREVQEYLTVLANQ